MKIRIIFNVILIMGLLAALGLPSQSALADPRIYYVKPNGTGNCLSWANACKLQTALGLAVSGDEIWVAAGTHYPDVLFWGDRSAAFHLQNGVGIYGGFSGTETARDQRDWNTNHTYLSGNIGLPGTRIDNSFHVVYSEGNDASAVLDGFIIEYGFASGSTGVEMFGGGLYLKSSNPTLSNLRIHDNWAVEDGGGMYSVDSSPTLLEVEFHLNTAFHDGGGMYNLDSNPTLEEVLIDANYADNNGGGVYNNNSSPALSDVTIEFNGAWNNGGGLYNLDSSPTMEGGLIFVNNSGNGGGVYNNNSSPTFTDVSFVDNYARGNGGGMYNLNSSPTVEAVLIFDNVADNIGGGMYNTNSSPALTNVSFEVNWAWDGGGMYNANSSPALSDVIFKDNGAWSNGGGMYNQDSSPALTDVTFQGNSADWNGGGMYNISSSPTLAEVAFDGNRAGNDGAGIFSLDSSLVLANAAFDGNVANTFGGGLFFSNSTAVLANTRFYENTADAGGGLFVVNNSHLSVNDATFNANVASAGRGGGIWQEVGSSVSVYNSILWDNNASVDGDEYYGHVEFSINPADPPYNLVRGGCIPDNCLNVDPQFIAAPAGDLRVELASPAVDVGNNSLLPQDMLDLDADGNTGEPLPIDLRGYPRIANGVVDLGAYETPPPRIYVDHTATGAEDGSSWMDAFTDLPTALGWAIDGVEVWVAEGVYLPTEGDDRYASFELGYEVELYGGFVGTEGLLSERDWEAHPTYLSGNVGDPSDNADNSHHVVVIHASAILDGFTIMSGNANNGADWGGGVWIDGDYSPILANLIFLANYAGYGGGLYSEEANPTLSNVAFEYNSAALWGGGMYVESGDLSMDRAMFINNRAALAGGGLYLKDGGLEVINTIFWDNSTSFQGGAAYLWGGALELINTSFNHNAANRGAAIFNDGADLALANTILWDNPSEGAVHAIEGYADIRYSLVQNGCPPMATCDHATNLYGIDPTFVEAAAGNLRLVPDPAISPAIDVGQNAALPAWVLTDLDGNPRLVDLAGGGANVDLGAYETQNIAPIALGDSYLTLEDTALEITDAAEGVLFNDEDANGDLLTAVLDQAPANGDLLFNTDGTFTYTPAPGFTGDDSFSYVADDGRVSSSPALVTITVREVNHEPIAQPDSYETERYMPLHVLAADGVLFNDSDPDGDELSAVLELDPLHGTLTLAADGSFTYLPEDGYVGLDQFAYHAYDGQLESNMVEVTIEVVNTPPIAVAESYQVDKNQVLTVSDPAEGLLGNDEDGNGDALIVMLEHEPGNGELSMNDDGTFEYIPAVGFSGVDEFAYCASDGVDESNMVWIEIRVINHVPLAVVDSYDVTANTPLRILDTAEGVLANDSDPDGDPLRVQFYTEPLGGLMLYPDGTFIYTPLPNFYGTDSFTYIVTDLDAISEPIEVSLNIIDDRASLWLPMTVSP